MEPLISNCPPDNITARSIAYIRTKMSRLRDECRRNQFQYLGRVSSELCVVAIPSGQTGLKKREVLHESHTQSTDAPVVPPPSSAPDGTGEVFRVSRFCERLVQQGARKIHDNSVIAECFEIAPEGRAPSSSRHSSLFADNKDQVGDKCCSQRCCEHKTMAQESISDVTFFTEEDALSLQEMVEHMPLGNNASAANMAPKRPPRGKDEMPEWHIPQPSGKQAAERLKKTFKSSLSSPRPAATKSEQIAKVKSRGGVKVLPDCAQNEPTERKPRTGGAKKKKRRVTFERQCANDRKPKKLKSSSESISHGRSRKPDRKRKHIRKGRTKEPGKSHSKRAPAPSSRSNVFYDSVADSGSDFTPVGSRASSDYPKRSELARKAPLKGYRVKLSVFACLVLLQVVEIYFLTAFPMDGNKFFARNPDGSSGEGAARVSGALIATLFALLWYPLFTVHLIALLSYLIELSRAKLFRRSDAVVTYDSVASSRPSSLRYNP